MQVNFQLDEYDENWQTFMSRKLGSSSTVYGINCQRLIIER